MQPYFFPYLGYFSLISATDKWVVFDTPQFIRHGWIERNRVLNSLGEWQYIRVPLVKFAQKTAIKDVHIRRNENWQATVFAQLTCYKRKAPNYSEVIDFLKQAFEQDYTTISQLNVHLLSKTCSYLGLKFEFEVFSRMNVSIKSEGMHAGGWAVEIASAIGASTYINPLGGQEIFRKKEFSDRKIDLKFLLNRLDVYDQKKSNFQPGLSILDAMMFLEREELTYHINNYQLIEA